MTTSTDVGEVADGHRHSLPQPFKTKTEIDRYLSGDTIICLLCGRRYRGVGHHVVRAHDITIDEYKDRFGIPHTRSLVGESTRSAMSITTSQQHKDGVLKEHVKRLASQSSRAGRAGAEIKKVVRAATGRSMARERRVSLEGIHSAVDAIGQSQMTLAKVAARIGLTSGGLMYYARMDSSLQEKLKKLQQR